jgi:hypothetical protein
VALPPFGHPFWIGVKFFSIREDVLEVLGDGVDLLGSDQAFDQDPTVFAPRADFGVAGES